jgi:hypothetical protein
MTTMPLLAAIFGAIATANLAPAHVGECKWVHGRYSIANGSSVRRIWVVGTRRIIALYDDDNDLPLEVERYEREAGSSGDLNDALYGDFYVCAREASRPGWMQHVRLLRIKHLVLRGKPFGQH